MDSSFKIVIVDENPIRAAILQDGLKALTARLKEQAEAKQFDKAATRFTNAKAECLRELEETARAGEQREAAEIAAAIEYYERTGQSPPGYEIREAPEEYVM